MRENIINRSMRLFLNLGFKGVTMDDIANDMGISKKTIYAHFKNKEELVEAIAFKILDNKYKSIDALSQNSAHPNPIEELYLFNIYFIHHLKDQNTLPQFQLKKYYPKIYEIIHYNLFEKMRFSFLQTLEYGKIDGVFRKTIDINFISRMYFTVMTGIMENLPFPKETSKIPFPLESYLEYHLRAIVTDRGKDLLNNFINNNNHTK